MQQTFAGNGAKCVFSSGFFCAGVVQIKASPKLWTSVLVLVMCSFRGGLMGHTLARPAWPWSSCHVCGRQLVFTARSLNNIHQKKHIRNRCWVDYSVCSGVDHRCFLCLGFRCAPPLRDSGCSCGDDIWSCRGCGEASAEPSKTRKLSSDMRRIGRNRCRVSP